MALLRADALAVGHEHVAGIRAAIEALGARHRVDAGAAADDLRPIVMAEDHVLSVPAGEVVSGASEAGLADEHVVAALALHSVGARIAGQPVGPVAAAQQVIALAAGQRVVAGASAEVVGRGAARDPLDRRHPVAAVAGAGAEIDDHGRLPVGVLEPVDPGPAVKRVGAGRRLALGIAEDVVAVAAEHLVRPRPATQHGAALAELVAEARSLEDAFFELTEVTP